ncbi:MAG: response regulator [Planctomycetota bacterium]
MTRVLFVDDEPNVLAGLRRLLRGQRGDWDMHFAASGPEALELCTDRPFDVVVSDMRMPGMDGASLLSQVQRDWPDTVRLALSGQSDLELTLRAAGPAHQYLSKPCDADQLRETISRTCAVRDQLSRTEVRSLVSDIGWLPSLPDAYVELLEEMNSPESSIESVSQIIARDVGMSAKVLKLINSSFFGLPVHVESVEHAAALLGMNVLRPLVLGSQVFAQFDDDALGGFSLSAFVDHSLCVAMAARQIATLQEAPTALVDNALLAGLTHDVGQIVLAQNLPTVYRDVCDGVKAGDGNLDEIENQAFGLTHAEIGGYLLSLWGLPHDIVEAVTLHHHPSLSPQNGFSPLTAVHVAEAIVVSDNESVTEDVLLDTTHVEQIGCSDRLDAWRESWQNPLAAASS